MSSTATGPPSIREAEFDSPLVGRLIAEMNAERAARMPAFSPSAGSTVVPADFVAPRGAFLVAQRGGMALGCGGVRRLGPGVGEIKRLFVSRPARGTGIGRALLCAIEARATSLGYRALRLDNDGGERAALRLFRAQGYRQIEDYNGNEYAQYWFEKELPREAIPTRSCREACS